MNFKEDGLESKFRTDTVVSDWDSKYFNKWGWIFDKKRILRNKECLDALSQKK